MWMNMRLSPVTNCFANCIPANKSTYQSSSYTICPTCPTSSLLHWPGLGLVVSTYVIRHRREGHDSLDKGAWSNVAMKSRWHRIWTLES